MGLDAQPLAVGQDRTGGAHYTLGNAKAWFLPQLWLGDEKHALAEAGRC
jgi:hypothetical protein